MRREGAASPKAARNTKHLKSVQLQCQDTRGSSELARAVPQQLRRRRDAARRLPPLENGVVDAWAEQVRRPERTPLRTTGDPLEDLRLAWCDLKRDGLLTDSLRFKLIALASQYEMAA